MKVFGVLLTLVFLGGTQEKPGILAEAFEATFPSWESGWLTTNSNIRNYYGVGMGRGNNSDHFFINHDNQGAYCLSEVILVTAQGAWVTIADYEGLITLDAQVGKGSWSLSSGNGSFVDTVSNDGLAVYSFSDADNGVASFALNYTGDARSINVDVYDSNNVRDDDTEGKLSYSATGFTITASALPNPPPTLINDPIQTQVSGQAFTLRVAAYGTDPNSG